ncbi:hypothetical protein [Winogradskyella flava]|uniref:Adhesin domain-containing protein n=1 Tax=Winogradskyella flava TaxID=1884876 RepID=A0A842IR54_9FLAO|nr:hypothetical protein [Winogradskyella flava]MBC2845321.1 hypothetical protein [Winogradskyella flava]
MKHIIAIITLLLITGVGHAQDQEKRIKFNNGTLKICSNSHMTIKGYDGDEVIIKSLNNKGDFYYNYNFSDKNTAKLKSLDSTYRKAIKLVGYINKKDQELEKGLKPLGDKSTNPADNLYLDIIEKPGELTIRDYNHNQSNNNKADGYKVVFKGDGNKKSKRKNITGPISLFHPNNKYEILIPNSIKLSWNVDDCSKKKSNTFFVSSNSKPLELLDFDGEVEISTSYKSIQLTDVKGPTIVNTIGGNIKVAFDNIVPTNLYSLVSNDGYIDVTLPEEANINVDAKGDRILSNVDFIILKDDIINGVKTMKLKLNSGQTKLKIDSGSGSVYLRKQE